MRDLKQQFQEETKLSFSDIPINGVHLEYINWLEKRIEALSIANVVGRSELFKCPICCDTKVKDNGDYCADCEEPPEGI